MMPRRLLVVAACAALASTAAAQDVQTFLYDANGRLTGMTTARTVGNSAVSYYVLDDADNRTLYGQFPLYQPPAGDTLTSAYALVPTQKLTSANGQYTLTFETTGDLVVRNASGTLIWNSCTGQGRSVSVVVDPTGRLAMYDTHIALVWSAGPATNPGAYLQLQNSGVAVLKTSGGSTIWTSSTPCA